MQTLKKGTNYDIDSLKFFGWSNGECHINGYSAWDYFDEQGRYLGPDMHGIEPLFTLIEEKE